MSADSRLARIRADEYVEIPGCTYLNAASWGLMPERAVRRGSGILERRWRGPLIPDTEEMDLLALARQTVGRLLGVPASDVLLCPNTTYGVNLAAALVASGPPGTIVLSDREFPANVYPWLALERRGFRVRKIPTLPGGLPDEDAMLAAVSEPDVRALAVSSVQFASGFRADLERLGRRCTDHDVLFMVDAIQELGSGPIDVKAAGIDVLACGAQKWLLGPWGAGFAFVDERHHARFDPPMVSWLSFVGATDFENLVDYDYTFEGDARKFELATLGLSDYVAMTASLEMLLEIGLDRVRSYLLELTAPLVEWAESRSDVTLVSPAEPARRAGVVMVRPPRLQESADALHEAGVVCAVREGALRLSPHVYNTGDEVARAIEILSRVNP